MPAAKDISIIGGGMVGLCAALVLQHPQRSLVILEAGNMAQAKALPLNARSIALSASSVQIFKAMKVWDSIQAHATPIRRIHISSRGRWGVTRLRAGELQLDALGYVIESQKLGQCLQQAVEACPGIEIHCDASFESIRQQQGVIIEYRSGGGRRRVDSAITLIADGANSKARDALAIGHQRIDYGQTVIICNVQVSKPAAATAYERFTEQGPLAMLPLGSNRYACICTLSATMAQGWQAMSDAEFIAALQSSFGFRLGIIEAVGERHDFALVRTRADRLARQRCFLLGNAANALHPVAGQSFNLALRDLACLYELLVDLPLDAADDAVLEAIAGDYQRLRAQEQEAVIRLGDGLVTLFSNDLPLLGYARGAALALLDVLPPLKQQVAFTGMGLSFAANRLLRGRL